MIKKTPIRSIKVEESKTDRSFQLSQKTDDRESGTPPGENPPQETVEGQLALDIYQTTSHIVIVAPIAGVKLNDINVALTEDVLTIKGKRLQNFQIPPEDYFTQECFWGEFSRSIVLPSSVDSSKISASFKDGVLKITMPRTERSKTKVVRIKSDQ